MVLLAALGGCASMDQGPGIGCGGSCGGVAARPVVPGVQGPRGEPVAMIAPYSSSPPGAEAAREMMARNMPMDLVQQASATGSPNGGSGIMQAGGQMRQPSAGISPAGMPFQPVAPGAGCGPTPPNGAVAAVGALTSPSSSNFPTRRSEVRFVGPTGMRVSWYAPAGPNAAGFASNHIDAPGRYNFIQGAVYRLKLTNIPRRPGLELYPTLEVVPSNINTDAFLAHSSVPVSFTDEDFEQVAAGNFVVKVVYLPAPEFQELATTAPDEVVSTRLQPGADPVAEAHRRGNILLIVRVGNIDLEAPNTPAMDAPNPYAQRTQVPMNPMMRAMMQGQMPGQLPGQMPGQMMQGPMVQPMLPPAMPTATPPASVGPAPQAYLALPPKSGDSGVQQASYTTTTTADKKPVTKWWSGQDNSK
jgi:hypothetical protein